MRFLIAIFALMFCSTTAAADEPTYKLKLSTRQAINKLLDVERPLKSGLRLNTETHPSKIVIRGRSTTSEIKLSIALVHPSAAPKDALVAAGAAILRSPGSPALQDDIEEVVNRLRSSGQEIAWTLPEETSSQPAQEDEPQFTNVTWLSVAGFGLLVAAFWHHRRRMNENH